MIKPLVELRTSGSESAAFNLMESSGATSLYLSVEDGGGSRSFHFNTPHDAATFAKSMLESLHAFIDMPDGE